MKFFRRWNKAASIISLCLLLAVFMLPSCTTKDKKPQVIEKPSVAEPSAISPKSFSLSDFPRDVTKESAGCVSLEEISGTQRLTIEKPTLVSDLSEEQIKAALNTSENGDIALISYMLYVNTKLNDEKSLWYLDAGIQSLKDNTYAPKNKFFGVLIDSNEGKYRAAKTAIILADYFSKTGDESVMILLENTMDILSRQISSKLSNSDTFEYDIDLHALISSGLLHGGSALKKRSYIALGIDTIERIRTAIQSSDTTLPLKAETAVLIAFTDAYEYSGNALFLEDAEMSARRIIENFWSEDAGAFISTYNDDPYVCPEDNATASDALLKISFLTDEEEYHDRAQKAVELFGDKWYGPMSARALYVSAKHPLKVAVIGEKTNPVTDALREEAMLFYEPDKAVMTIDPANDVERLEELPYKAREIPTMYACVESACSMPVSDPSLVVQHLSKFVRRYMYEQENNNGLEGMSIE